MVSDRAGGHVGPDSRVVLSGLWASAPVRVTLSIQTRKRFRWARVFVGDYLLRWVKADTQASNVSFDAVASPAGELVVRIVPQQSRAQVHIRPLRLAVEQAGPAAIPRGRVLLYGLYGTLLAWVLRRAPLATLLAGLALGPGLVAAWRLHSLTLLPAATVLLALYSLWVTAAERGWVDALMPRWAATWVVALLAFRVVVVLHPNFAAIDSTFHRTRALVQQAGQLVLSSAPGVATAWYPPAAHVVIGALINGSPAAHARDLRVIHLLIVLLEAAGCVVVYRIGRAAGLARDPAAGAAAVLLAMPEGLLVAAKGIAPNVFGSLAGLGVTLAIVGQAAFATLWAALSLLFLSHVGAAIATLGLLVLMVLRWRLAGELSKRDLGRIAAALALAAGVAWAVYYREAPLALERQPGQGLLASMWHVHWFRAGKLAQDLLLKFGLAPLLLAAYGARECRRHVRLWTLLVSWFLVALALAAAAVLTPFPLRAEYFVMPAIALAAGAGAARLRDENRRWLAHAAIAVTALIQVVIGLAYVTHRFRLISVIVESPRWPFPVRFW